ncbi:radical SAM protein [Fodinicurvata sp. EGI_FJ10296]|uniref:B12-binding domain-containing radical SAM protein n=1 Tax=Fodinicurvata sp. EGI_FJ10296 TaxID=3231908 RepID=UPI003456979D
MKVALVIAVSEYAAYTMLDQESDPPLGVLYLATIIRDRHEVRIFDGQLSLSSPEDYAAEVLAWEPDVVGFSVNFSTVARNTWRMAEAVRAARPQMPIVLGGNFATFHAEEVMGKAPVDYVLLHEAEVSFPALLDRLADPTSPMPDGIVFRDGDGSPVRLPFGRYIQDLDELPFPDFDLFDDPSRYAKSMVTSRGCPYTCVYCSTREMWKKWRSRSAENMVDEMMALQARYGCSQVLLADDIFIVNKKRVHEVCDLLIERGSLVRWGFSTRLETLKDEMMPKLARAGVTGIFLGIESASERVLAHMERRYTRQEIIDKIDRLADFGITASASFIIGLPWETEEDVRVTFETMRRIRTHRVLLNIFTPLSGTLSLSRPEDYGLEFIETYDPERAVVGHGYVNFNTPHLTAQRIKHLWLEGQAIVIAKGREKSRLEAELSRNRYGLLADPAAESAQAEETQSHAFG